MNREITSLIGLLLSLGLSGCEAPVAASSEPAPAVAATATQAATRVTKIVVVGKQNACDCTRKTIDAGWAALEQALGTPAKLPVERLQIDTEGSKVEPYRSQKPIMALPAIYFVGAEGTVLGMLQGEVTAQQISAAINNGVTP